MRFPGYSELHTAASEVSEAALQPAPEPLTRPEPTGLETQADSPDDIFREFGFREQDFIWSAIQDESRSPETRNHLRELELKEANERYEGTTANCYYFAFGWPPEDISGWAERPQPGQLALSRTGYGSFEPFEFDRMLHEAEPDALKAYLIKLCREDCQAYGKELVEVSEDYQPKQGERVVVLLSRQPHGILRPLFTGGADYHFLLKGQYGSYLHKRGLASVTDRDLYGRVIDNVEQAKTGYDTLHGYFVLRNQEV